MAEIIRIGTWNVHHGAPPGKNQSADLDKYHAACVRLAKLGLDILGLQEVEKHVHRSEWEDLTKIAATITGMKPVFARAMWKWHQGGQYGNALLVRDGIYYSQKVKLRGDRRHPVNFFGHPLKMNGNQVHWMFERRNAIVAHISVRGYDVAVANTHIGGMEDVRKRNIAKVASELAITGGDNPLVYIGDWNTEIDELARWREPAGMELAWHPGITTCGKRYIDHVAVRDLIINDVWTEQLPVSDHRALIVEAAL